MGVAIVTQQVVNTFQKDQCNVVLAIEGTPDSSNKMDRFSYKGGWANA